MYAATIHANIPALQPSTKKLYCKCNFALEDENKMNVIYSYLHLSQHI